MYSKSLLIAIAAFALTATGVNAYGGIKVLGRAGLTDDQVEAIEEARELREMGDYTGARDKLVKAGVTDDTLKNVHRATNEVRIAIEEALNNNDFKAFKVAIADLPLADIITSKEDFQQFKEAHDLKKAGKLDQSSAIMSVLGVDSVGGNSSFGHMHRSNLMENLTDQQIEALRVARQANDRATMQAIYDEAGVEGWSGQSVGHHHMIGWR